MPSYVVAGASRGLGLEFVVQLLAKGNVVIALARNPEGAKKLLAIQNKNLHIVKGDTTDPASLQTAAEATAKITGGSLDVLINNAAHQDPNHIFHGIDEFPDATSLIQNFNMGWTTNVLGPILTTNAFLPLLKKGNLKKVMTLSTGLGDPALNLDSGFDGHTAYCVTKCALEMVNVKFAVRYKDQGFVFLAISPGVVNTAEAPPPAEIIPKLQAQAACFQKVYPDWKGPIDPPESVGLMLGVLGKVTPADSGKFLSHHGNRQWL